MKQSDYITILAPMVTDLKLSGNALIIFALIHGFTKDGEHTFHGSIDYISKWTNISKPSVISNLKKMTEDGLLNKKTIVENGVKFCHYTTNYDDLTSSKETLLGGSKETLQGSKETLPNIDKDNNNRDIDSSRVATTTKRFTPPTLEEVKDYIFNEALNVNAEYFFDYYTANGWMAGSRKMRDWKATARNWSRRENGEAGREKSSAKRENDGNGLLHQFEENVRYAWSQRREDDDEMF